MSADQLFKELEPPRGGSERFARRLEAVASASGEPHRQGVAWAVAAVVAAISVAIVILVWRLPGGSAVPPVAESQPVPNIYDSPAFDRLLGRPLQAETLTATVGQQRSMLTELESRNAKVRIYRID